MKKLFDAGIIDPIPKEILAKVLLEARQKIGKGEDDWDTRDSCKAIELLPEEFRSQFNGADAVKFKNMMQRLRKDKIVPKVHSPKQMEERFQKFIRDFEKNRERRGTEHLSSQYINYVVNQSEEWIKKAREHKERCNFRCQLCGRTSKLEVHHTSEGYRNLTREEPWHLIAVCAKPCHVIADMLREGWFYSQESLPSFLEDDF
jgi:hypothetical protein